MPLTVSANRAEQELTARALRQLRERSGVFQRDVARELGMTTQGWSKYEAGERKFTPERLEAVLAALGMTEEDLESAKDELLGRAASASKERTRSHDEFLIDVYGRARAGTQGQGGFDVGEPLRQVDLRRLIGPSVDAFEVAGDSMAPWAEPGEIVLFDRDRYPKRGAGCVIEMKTGESYVKLYQSSDGSTLFAKELQPEERVINFPLKDVKGVYAILLRGD